MSTWLLGTVAVAAVGAVVAAARARRRRPVPGLPLRLPVSPADQDEIRALLAGERDVDAVELLRRRYRLPGDDARAVAGDVFAHPDYPCDWGALAAALDPGLRDEVRRLVAAGRRSAALRLVRLRFGLPLPDADSLVSALVAGGPADEA
ncbi:MAG TPA: hypothetical protein VE781_09460 [Kineosporiaceae bacterium]|nr:hypothetical protein [Kineosporiaceae bacterium]